MSQVDLYDLKRGKGPPLIGVHGAGGMLFMGRLATHLGAEQAFYALQGRGLDRLDRADPEFTGIRQLAAAYADVAAGLVAEEPVFVYGRWGPIVLETGHALQARDVKVAALIIVDSTPGVTRKPHIQRLPEPESSWGVLAGALRIRGSRTRLRSWLKKRKRAWKSHKLDPFRLQNKVLLEGYQPGKFRGRINLILSERFANKPGKQHRASVWRLFCDELQVYVTPGGHKYLYLSPNVESLGTLIQGIVEGVENPAFRRDTG